MTGDSTATVLALEAAFDRDAAPQSGPPPTWDRPVRRVVLTGALILVCCVSLTVVALAARARLSGVREAAAATSVSDAYQDALHAATVEQSLERAWRLGRQPEVVQFQQRAAHGLDAALDRVAAAGGRSESGPVATARRLHAVHLTAFGRVTSGSRAEDASAAEASSEDLQDALSADARRAYGVAEAHRRGTTAPIGWLGLLFALGAGAAGTAVAIALLAATGDARRLRALRDQAETLAFRDTLTGLPNRAVLRDRLEQALRIGAREQTCTALLVIDLDRFKEINDALGHDYGDRLLELIEPRLREPLRESDTIARLGGDEFAVLLPNVQDLAAAVKVAEKLQSALVEPFRIKGLPLSVEASIGVVVAPEHGIDGGTLLQRADVAMYVAKDGGLGVAAYDEAADGSSPARAALLGELRRAIDEGELLIEFQPKRSAATGSLEGVEALVRWQHPTQGLLAPGEFLPLAERTGLVHALTRFVLGAALGECRRWYDLGIELPVAVNLSARTLVDRTFAHDVEQMLAFWQLPGHLLELEVTETAVMADPERAHALLERLGRAGIVLAIDDFGTGYSSLVNLRTLPVHDLKIDRTFVTDMLTNPNDAFIVRSVIMLAHDVGLRVVAEGVENAATLDALHELGCDVVQGFHVGRPMTGNELSRMLAGPQGAVTRPARAAAHSTGG